MVGWSVVQSVCFSVSLSMSSKHYFNNSSFKNYNLETLLRLQVTVSLSFSVSCRVLVSVLAPAVYLALKKDKTIRTVKSKLQERKPSWSILNVYAGVCLERLRTTTKNVIQVSRYLGRDTNIVHPEYQLQTLPHKLTSLSSQSLGQPQSATQSAR